MASNVYTAKANGRSNEIGSPLFDVTSAKHGPAYINVLRHEAADLVESLNAAHAQGVADERQRARARKAAKARGRKRAGGRKP